MKFSIAEPSRSAGSVPAFLETPEHRMFFGALLSSLLFAAPLQLAAGDPPKVAFVAHGPVGLKIEGSSSTLAVTGDETALTFTMPVASLTTGIELRDKHLREALQAETFPLATLQIQRAALPAANTGSFDAPATLTLHGQTQPLTLHCLVHRGTALEVSATTQLDLTKFGIEPPAYMGMKVKPEVEVSVSLRLQELSAGVTK